MNWPPSSHRSRTPSAGSMRNRCWLKMSWKASSWPWNRRTRRLESQRANWQKASAQNTKANIDPAAAAQAAKQANWHRQRLLVQAKALRTFRQQVRESQATLSAGRAELTENREQLRARKENLEQVKRLLEKQEMVMARRELADHNAIKTVAAVGIFVIMVLGSVFFGVYRFVHPVYRSQALVTIGSTRGPARGGAGRLASSPARLHADQRGHLGRVEDSPRHRRALRHA